ncbi:MAG TPA: ABC transporter substrate binding protein [Gammaproteobacteria bacterium]
MARIGSIASTCIALLAASLAASCRVAPVEPAPEPPPAAPETPPAPLARTPAEPPAEAAPARPAPAEASAAPPAAPKRVLVLLPPESSAFAPVLPHLEAELAARGFGASTIALDGLPPDAPLATEPPALVIAVGTAATRAALDRQPGAPVVFCQVPDVGLAAAPNVWGVASLPPLELQLRAWRRVYPGLRTIALVLGRDETVLAAEARRAAAAQGVGLDLFFASSDQEAVYLFKREAADVDGLWLLPDSTVLSPRAIREMLDHAAARRLETLVFTPTLLEWGALLSVTPTDLDLARTLASVAEAVAAGSGDELPPITPLSELEARVNTTVAERLGLRVRRGVWIERAGLP